MAVEKGFHGASQIHYHLVFPVNYRRALLRDEVVAVVREVAEGIEERYGLEIEGLGCDRNRLHLLCSAHPKSAPGQLGRRFKSITARELFARVPGLKRSLWGGEFWSDGYHVAAVGERANWGVVEKYVCNQGFTEDEAQLRLL